MLQRGLSTHTLAVRANPWLTPDRAGLSRWGPLQPMMKVEFPARHGPFDHSMLGLCLSVLAVVNASGFCRGLHVLAGVWGVGGGVDAPACPECLDRLQFGTRAGH